MAFTDKIEEEKDTMHSPMRTGSNSGSRYITPNESDKKLTVTERNKAVKTVSVMLKNNNRNRDSSNSREKRLTFAEETDESNQEDNRDNQRK